METPQPHNQMQEQEPQLQPVQDAQQEVAAVEAAFPASSFSERNQILVKGFLVGLLILLMLIPRIFVSDLVNERRIRQQSVINEVSDKWAGEQTITGPVLMLPYRAHIINKDGKDIELMKMAYVLPDELRINSNMVPAVKKRSLYQVMLYGSQTKLEGKFNALPLEALNILPEDVVWKEARLMVSVGDMRGITEQVSLNWNGAQTTLETGIPENAIMKDGISIPVAVSQEGGISFSINLALKGSGFLYFTPLGKSTDLTLSAPWKDPAFDGQYLPDNSNITKNNFAAHWRILPMSHNFPQYWKDASQDLQKAAFGVRLVQPADGYSKTDRSVKYALLFIALTFTFFFFLELLLKRQIHPIQYLLVGMALTIFYTLLLSISEYTGFNFAYLIASVATVSLIGIYVWGIFKEVKTAIGFIITLAGLYSYIFILIRSEDYALLFGSIGLFAILAAIMYFSRRIDWYAPAKTIKPQHAE